MEITLLDPTKRLYGMRLDTKLYLASLVDLPCVIEAQKTLDYKTFYKSCDAAQMMYVHNIYLEGVDQRTDQEIGMFVSGFNPLTDDEQFF
jgi:TATA-binding protein-associated factor Taf7